MGGPKRGQRPKQAGPEAQALFGEKGKDGGKEEWMNVVEKVNIICFTTLHSEGRMRLGCFKTASSFGPTKFGSHLLVNRRQLRHTAGLVRMKITTAPGNSFNVLPLRSAGNLSSCSSVRLWVLGFGSSCHQWDRLEAV